MSFFVISYKRKDIEFVKEVKNQLHANGFVAWYDDNIQGGDDWKIVIDNAIKDFLGVILVVTPAALASQYVTYEWSFALGRDKKVIPVILEHPDPNDLDSPQMHPRLLDKNYRDFSVADNQPWEKLFEDLTAIRQALLIHLCFSRPLMDFALTLIQKRGRLSFKQLRTVVTIVRPKF